MCDDLRPLVECIDLEERVRREVEREQERDMIDKKKSAWLEEMLVKAVFKRGVNPILTRFNPI